MDSERYDIFAKSPSADPQARNPNSRESIQTLASGLQTLLAQRFQLRINRRRSRGKAERQLSALWGIQYWLQPAFSRLAA